ncbi:serine/arginine-rich splicing factor 1-like isoform X2 [Dreissena polymorpha]|nr:serine/arginine-rich splicing factor 1-like isoform X2 [Dreissena polymorpha]
MGNGGSGGSGGGGGGGGGGGVGMFGGGSGGGGGSGAWPTDRQRPDSLPVTSFSVTSVGVRESDCTTLGANADCMCFAYTMVSPGNR